jgi:multidrug efflux pump subunit AcrB
MKAKWVAVAIILVCFGLIFWLNNTIPSELAPLEDRSLIRTPITAPEGTDFDYTETIVAKATQMVLDSIPEQRMVFGGTAPAFGGVGVTNSGFVNLILSDPDERNRSQQQVYQQLMRMFKRIPEARLFPNQEQTISTSLAGGFQLPVQFVIQTLDFNQLQQVLPKFIEEARKSDVFSNVDANLKFNKPELRISIDRLKAAELGVSVRDVATVLQSALSGGRFGYFLMSGKQYQVIGQVDRSQRDEPVDLKSLYVRNNKGQLIQLDNVILTEEMSSPPQLYHFNRYKSATVSASLAEGKTIGEGIEVMKTIAAKHLDDSFATELSGPSRDFAESASNTSFALILALMLIYLILAAQFESFRDPLIIMFTVPLALAGALLSLWIGNFTLNIFSQIGMIMLVGLVTKNGILIVEFANQKCEEGMAKQQAVIEAAKARLRPILMTTLATVLGALPIAMALGAGAQSRVPLGVVIVGGLMFSLVLTLFVIPVMYVLFAAQKQKQEV